MTSWRCVVLMLLVVAPGVGAQQAPELGARVDSLFAPWTGNDRPGCVVGVSQRGQTILERAYGMADLESGVPMTPNTVVHAASIAKQVTALSLLLLERDGRLSLDDDVRRWMPELPDYRPRSGRPVTIRHLLDQTSGMRDFFELLILARGRFDEDRITEADALAMVVRQRALNFAPGTEYGYSNTGYLLAARLVRLVSGESLPELAAERIFTPLGMTHTMLRDDAGTLVPGRALGYTRRGAGWRLSLPNYDVVGPTNMKTTVGDLLRLAENLHDPKVGDSSIVRRMTTPGVLANGDTTTYGLGLSLQRDRGFRLVEHEGRDPGFRAYLGTWMEPRLTVALLCNTTTINSVAVGRQVAGFALGATANASPATAAPTALRSSNGVAHDSTRALAWAGVYLEPTTRQVAELTVRNGVLYTDRLGGARIEAMSDRRAKLVGQPLELEYDNARSHPGYTVRWLIPGRRADRFIWKAPKTLVLDRAALALFAGTYRSEELDATYRVEAGDSTLTLRAGATPGLVARPVFPDGFVAGQYTIQFVRRDGRVAGFEISHPRARGLLFSRVRSASVGF